MNDRPSVTGLGVIMRGARVRGTNGTVTSSEEVGENVLVCCVRGRGSLVLIKQDTVEGKVAAACTSNGWRSPLWDSI